MHVQASPPTIFEGKTLIDWHSKKRDIGAACLSAIPCAAGVTIIDQAVTQHAAKTATIRQSVTANFKKMLFKPKSFFGGRAYLAVMAVYSLTYIAANTSATFCRQRKITATGCKIAATSSVNIASGVTKDTMFAIWFGDANKPKRAFPPMAWACFILRDVLTIGAGFVFPTMVSKHVQKTGLIQNKNVADVACQLTVPVACQAVLTPVHLMALDIYNRPTETVRGRVGYIRQVLAQTASARCVRVLVIYGIAGTLNKFWLQKFDPDYC